MHLNWTQVRTILPNRRRYVMHLNDSMALEVTGSIKKKKYTSILYEQKDRAQELTTHIINTRNAGDFETAKMLALEILHDSCKNIMEFKNANSVWRVLKDNLETNFPVLAD